MTATRPPPPPEWYIQLGMHGERERARQLRYEIKRSWSHELEQAIAGKLRNLKHFFPTLIADLPGGNHSVMPPLRIPPGREVVMNAVDVFVVLGRAGEPAADAWVRELAARGLDDRIVAILDSAEPLSAPAARLDASAVPLRGVVAGLDRSQALDGLVHAMQGSLRPLVRKLLP